MTSAKPSGLAWKSNWSESRRRFEKWWAGEGAVVGCWWPPLSEEPRAGVAAPWPGPVATPTERMCNVRYRVDYSRAQVARQWLGLDCLPMVYEDFGPGSLATMLGSEPQFERDTVWYHPIWDRVLDPQALPAIVLNPQNRWYAKHLEVLRECRQASGDDYAVGMPDLIEGLDTLASLRGTSLLLEDLVERPGWVSQKVREINQAWLVAFDACRAICRTAEDWTFTGAFRLAGPGRTAKLQCDLSAMISPGMFSEFCVPHLTEQCNWCEHTMFHLDGSQCICHLDLLLGIEKLGAIEWTPDPQVPGTGDRRWWEMYRHIKSAGKGVQTPNLKVHEVAPLLDGVGPEGMYLLVDLKDWKEAEELEKIVTPYLK